jgi:hypothetical protein
MNYSWHSLIPLLSFLLNHLGLPSPELYPILSTTVSCSLLLCFYYSSESELYYDWRFTAHHFVLATSLLRATTSTFSAEGHNPHVTSSLTRGRVCRLPTRCLAMGIHVTILCASIRHLPGSLCGLVVRVFGYRSRGPGFDSRPYQIF